MGKKLYVGNLSHNVDNASLEALFATYGTVNSAEVIHDRDTGRSKGFGFVEMADDNAAQEAIRGLNETQQNGRPLTDRTEAQRRWRRRLWRRPWRPRRRRRRISALKMIQVRLVLGRSSSIGPHHRAPG